jgi:hypothetical protein
MAINNNFIRKRKLKSVIKAYHGGACEAIGKIERGCERFIFTKGQILLIDILRAILDQTGPADLDILTWAVGNETINKLTSIKRSGKIKNMRLIIDYSAQSMHPDYCKKMRRLFGDDNIRVTKNHAKVLILHNNEWNLCVRSSMNLNVNRRLEYVEISDSPELMAFFSEFFEEWWMTRSTGATWEKTGSYHGDELKKFGQEDTDFNFDFDIKF